MRETPALNREADVTLAEVKNGEVIPSRRRFMRNVAVGATGVTLGMTRADRVLARQTQSHVNLLFAPVTNFSLTAGAKQDFLSVANNVLSIANEGGEAKSSFNAIRTYLSNSLVSIPYGQAVTVLGLPKDASDTIATAYLRALVGIRDRQITETQIRQGLANPKAIFDSFESDFVNLFAEKVKAERANNSSFAQKVVDATTQFKSASEELSGAAISRQLDARSVQIRLVSFKHNPGLIQASCDCNINGTCAHWAVCIGLVVVFVVIILTK